MSLRWLRSLLLLLGLELIIFACFFQSWVFFPEEEIILIIHSRETPSSSRRMRYHEMSQEHLTQFEKRRAYTTAFTEATVIESARSWFKPRNDCKATCCAQTVAISLDQDDHHIINTVDGLDLADVLVNKYKNPPHLEFFASNLTSSIIPCLQPGTIIHLDNHGNILKDFFNRLRPNITVPYVLITSESDADTPYVFGERLSEDDLLIKWYGQSPNMKNVPVAAGQQKLEPFPLGLSKHHDQSRYLSRYLELRNFTNPFRGKKQKQRWTNSPDLALENDRINLQDTLFVKFGINPRSRKHRQPLFDMLCRMNGTGTPRDKVSCQLNKVSPHEIYAAASTYLFGLSPPGAGWDCYRTYELLLLGVIPIVAGREGGTKGLFKDLPVIELPDMMRNRTQDEYTQIMREYVKSHAFRENDFAGWERLFLGYWRRKILAEAGRDGDILKDESGREYYQAWRYTSKLSATA